MTDNEPLVLPVLPLRDLVLFPGVTMPIAAGRPATLKALEAAQAQAEPLILAVTQRQNTRNVTFDGCNTRWTGFVIPAACDRRSLVTRTHLINPARHRRRSEMDLRLRLRRIDSGRPFGRSVFALMLRCSLVTGEYPLPRCALPEVKILNRGAIHDL